MKKIIAIAMIMMLCLSTAAMAAPTNMQQTVRQDLIQMGIEIPDEVFEAACSEYGGSSGGFGKFTSGFGDLTSGFGDGKNKFAEFLLVYAGMGVYDYDTWVRTPICDDVLAMDAEVFDIDYMYTDFFASIQPLIPDVIFSDVTEDMTDMLDEHGYPLFEGGSRTVSFACNGAEYEVTLENYGDWFNPEIIDFVNELLAGEGCEKSLHVVSDPFDQIMIIVYENDENAELLRHYISR